MIRNPQKHDPRWNSWKIRKFGEVGWKILKMFFEHFFRYSEDFLGQMQMSYNKIARGIIFQNLYALSSGEKKTAIEGTLVELWRRKLREKCKNREKPSEIRVSHDLEIWNRARWNVRSWGLYVKQAEVVRSIPLSMLKNLP